MGHLNGRLAVVAGALLAAALPSTAQAATSQTITASASAKQSCFQQYVGKTSTTDAVLLGKSGSGLVSARITGSTRGDWDVAIFDLNTQRVVAGGASWEGDELAEGNVDAGANLAVQACRYDGGQGSAKLTVGVASAGNSSGQTGKVQVVDVRTETRADKRRLQGLGLDLTEHGDSSSLEVVLHGDNDAKKLKDAGFTYRVRIADLAARMAANEAADARFAAATSVSPLPSGRDGYRHMWDYDYDMKWLNAQYPGLTRLLTLPYRTSEGRWVHGIEITKDAANTTDGKPVFLQMGVHHAREWPSSEHSIEFGFDLLVNYARSTLTKSLVDTTRTIVVPLVNKDGFNVSREARELTGSYAFNVNDHAMKRKTCFGVEGVCGTASRLAGIDPNRNYGGNWGGPGAGILVHDDTWRGDRPFQAPEVQNIRKLVSSRQVVTLITNHTYSNLLLRPPGLISNGRPIDELKYRALGQSMAEKNRYANLPSYALYDTSGTTEDWTYYQTGGLGFTFEIGPDEFHPPFPNVIDEYLGRGRAAGSGFGGNRAAYYEILKATADPAMHSRLTGSAPAGSRLSLEKTFSSTTAPVIGQNGQLSDPISLPEKVTSELLVGRGGTFTWNVNPSTRPAVAGTYGRDPQPGGVQSPPIELPNTSAGFPPPDPTSNSYEDITFRVDNTGRDNGRMNVHLEWANAADDWDVKVLRNGVVVGASESYGDNDEKAVIEDPESGEYVARIINWDASADWLRAYVTFDPPAPGSPTGTTEEYTITCGSKVTKVVVARGQTKAINPC